VVGWLAGRVLRFFFSRVAPLFPFSACLIVVIIAIITNKFFYSLLLLFFSFTIILHFGTSHGREI